VPRCHEFHDSESRATMAQPSVSGNAGGGSSELLGCDGTTARRTGDGEGDTLGGSTFRSTGAFATAEARNGGAGGGSSPGESSPGESSRPNGNKFPGSVVGGVGC
jgi:hypothetical protein